MAKIEEIYGVEQSKFFFSNLLKARKKIFDKIIDQILDGESILDVGTTPVKLKHENFFLNHYHLKENITCLSNQNLDKLKELYPNLKTILADGRDTKLLENSFDISISNATLEHVGNFEEQIIFVKEMYRISKKKIIVVTPNRFYPIDTHTMLPLIHWLPKKFHRKILKMLKYDFLALEKNLNLLSEKDLIEICNRLEIKNFKINRVKYFGFNSNLILIINKN
jgi:hypothetical protein